MADTASDSENNQEAVTDQPASSNAPAFEAVELTNDAEVEQQNADSRPNSVAAEDKEDEEGPTFGVEVGLGDDGECVSASAEYGSICFKECCGGASELDFQGPAVGCTLSKGDGLEIVSDCTTSCCTTDCMIAKLVLCTLGLALDNKLAWNGDEVEFIVLGTGLDTSEGFALAALGSKIGFADMEKFEKARERRRAKQEKKAKQKYMKDVVVDEQPTGRTTPTTEQA